MFKKILFSLFSLLLLNFSVKQGLQIFLNKNVIIGLNALGLAALINLCFTGVFAFVGFVYPTSKLLPKSYYKIKNANRLSFLYKSIGVKFFRIFLLLTVWKPKAKQAEFFNGTKGGIKKFIYETHQAEFGHFAALVFIQLFVTILLFNQQYELFIYTSIINCFFNFYPIVLQRYHRIRIEKVLEKIQK